MSDLVLGVVLLRSVWDFRLLEHYGMSLGHLNNERID